MSHFEMLLQNNKEDRVRDVVYIKSYSQLYTTVLSKSWEQVQLHVDDAVYECIRFNVVHRLQDQLVWDKHEIRYNDIF